MKQGTSIRTLGTCIRVELSGVFVIAKTYEKGGEARTRKSLKRNLMEAISSDEGVRAWKSWVHMLDVETALAGVGSYRITFAVLQGLCFHG